MHSHVLRSLSRGFALAMLAAMPVALVAQDAPKPAAEGFSGRLPIALGHLCGLQLPGAEGDRQRSSTGWRHRSAADVQVDELRHHRERRLLLQQVCGRSGGSCDPRHVHQ